MGSTFPLFKVDPLSLKRAQTNVLIYVSVTSPLARSPMFDGKLLARFMISPDHYK